MWIRTCQECGHKQEDINPMELATPAWIKFRDRVCKKCKSIGLDYGKEIDVFA